MRFAVIIMNFTGQARMAPRLNALRCPAELNWVNRKGAKGAKGLFVGFVLILEEGPQDQNTPSPDGRLLL